jgi:hypothetical protein
LGGTIQLLERDKAVPLEPVNHAHHVDSKCPFPVFERSQSDRPGCPDAGIVEEQVARTGAVACRFCEMLDAVGI